MVKSQFKYGGRLFQDLLIGERIKFPVVFDLKAIMDASVPEHENFARLLAVLESEKIPYAKFSHKISNKGKYISFSVQVEVRSYDVLQALYKKLGELPGLKFAV
jgi:putative lipoic acid-binding regulatory protein